MDEEEAKNLIVEKLKKKKGKSKFYLKDFHKMLPEMKPRAIKNLVNAMIREQTLEFWSSGSTTLYGLKGVGKQAAAEEGEEGED